MNEDIRETYHSAEYDEYYASLDAKTKAKYDYVETIIKTQYVVKQYKGEIETARQILNKYIQGGQEDDKA